MSLLGRNTLKDTVLYAAAGVVAGTLFGLYGGQAMLEMISLLVLDAPDATVGWGLHLVISAVFGAGYAEVKGLVRPTQISLPMLGILYGIGLWVIGPVTGMPLAMGDLDVIPNIAIGSLWGHIIYGASLQALGQVAVEVSPPPAPGETAERRLAWW